MLKATCIVLSLACITGCLLIPSGGWKLIIAGIFIAIFALAYSAGPYPLSYHGLGDVTVFIFFGLIAVNLSFYVQALHFESVVFYCSIAMGLLSVNILMVNNYRDKETDEISNKKTLVVIFGRKFAERIYLLNGIIALLITGTIWFTNGIYGNIAHFIIFKHTPANMEQTAKKERHRTKSYFRGNSQKSTCIYLLLVLVLVYR